MTPLIIVYFALWPVWSQATTVDAEHFVRAHTVRPQNGTGNDQSRRSPYLTVCSAIGAVHHATALSPLAHDMRPDGLFRNRRGASPRQLSHRGRMICAPTDCTAAFVRAQLCAPTKRWETRAVEDACRRGALRTKAIQKA